MSYEAVDWAFSVKVGSLADKAVLLALCHAHNPENGCFPSVEKIMSLTEIGSKRTVQKSLNALEAAGFITRSRKTTKKGFVNLYVLNIGRSTSEPRVKSEPRIKSEPTCKSEPRITFSDVGAEVILRGRCKSDPLTSNKEQVKGTSKSLTSTNAVACVDGEDPDWVIEERRIVSQEPVLIDLSSSQEEEPSVPVKKHKDGFPPCPVQKVVDLYHEVLPELPKARLLTKARESQIRARWKHICMMDKCTTQEQVLEIFRWMFERVRKSPFLMGLTDKAENHQNWKCNLEWITKEGNWAKIFEGNYIREG